MENIANLIACYKFDDVTNAAKDSSNNNMDGELCGDNLPQIKEIDGKMCAYFHGGAHGRSYIKLPENLFEKVNATSGYSVCMWLKPMGDEDAWERVFDFGKSSSGPYTFLTRYLRGVCFGDAEIASQPPKPDGKSFIHVAFCVSPTNNGQNSVAGPKIYINGMLASNDEISQTSSGLYKEYRKFEKYIEDGEFKNNFIGHSHFDVDKDFEGAMSDFRIYGKCLSDDDVMDIFCSGISDEELVNNAANKMIKAPKKIISDMPKLEKSLLNGRVNAEWSAEPKEFESGDISGVKNPTSVTFTAKLKKNDKTAIRKYLSTYVPKDIAPFEFKVHDKKVIDISDTLFGLFFEDINRCADGGIYAEMIQNRSFENFDFKIYDATSGKNGTFPGKNYKSLEYWFGDTDKVIVHENDGVSKALCGDDSLNPHYIELKKGVVIYNHGFCDGNFRPSMNIVKGEEYELSVYAKAKNKTSIKAIILDENNEKVTNEIEIKVNDKDTWDKYEGYVFKADKTSMSKIRIEADDTCMLDMISLFPKKVWGSESEDNKELANANYKGNPNYRLRYDIMQALFDMKPKFLRFPGGCISEGSYIWDNVYDWKDSVGDVAIRRENVNVWGYNMTMGLGYMEYFQMAEDLGALPLPVMACGILCQARSDYVNPAGGQLRDKYIKNFTDLVDFAISTDFENNKCARLRKDMGHEKPFDLHYLGVGNENWGDEFFANFEIFYHEIDEYMKKNYPGYDLKIVSTAGAQADDDAYRIGWQFLCGGHVGVPEYEFTDSKESHVEKIEWYKYKKDYLNTIVDEHYYRNNAYLLENVDRYNYYQRAYKDGQIDEEKSPKVFVGEYASNDKNTLRGAIAEAATMVGYERNSDVVRMASTAPLFNKVTTDNTYRWTPDCIWFDDRKLWRTPTYFVQKLFMNNIGTRLLDVEEFKMDGSILKKMSPSGGFSVSASNGRVLLKEIIVLSNKDGNILFEQNFEKDIAADEKLKMTNANAFKMTDKGLVIDGSKKTEYIYMDCDFLKDITVKIKATKLDESSVIELGTGLKIYAGVFDEENINMHKYCVGDTKNGSGLKVYKDGKEGYTMGEYTSSVYAGNLRAMYMDSVPKDKDIILVTDFGTKDGKHINCHYEEDGISKASLTYKLEDYNRDLFVSVTDDDSKVYMKVVNANEDEKLFKADFSDFNLSKKYKKIVLTGDVKLFDIPNVNDVMQEKIAPVESICDIEGNILKDSAVPMSLTIFVFDK